ncbi:hypothetical protein [Parabacteroides sp. Marseille-P3160]|uniref:hypothetical protein n=1 Tax=Parabacteroides sp. Marseille-P3160 TaxID=1917887 RepID=UPI001F1DB945|nr:hypothetical protein [Parabacteroides sp. Marseille-P3160]
MKSKADFDKYSLIFLSLHSKIDDMKFLLSKQLLGFVFLVSFGCLAGSNVANAQLADKVYSGLAGYKIEPGKEKQLFLELDNLNFFRDNEYSTKMLRGYTLPGFWLQAKAVYYPLPNLKIEGGLHNLWYWGAVRYPEATFQSLPTWQGKGHSGKVHWLPLLRAHLSLNEHFDLVFGHLYGGTNHGLITPLYNPELVMTADPETGLQLLFDSEHWTADLWVNWQSFIFQTDTHQEAFTVGLASRWKLNDPEAPLHFYAPIQVLAQHHGGEIDTITVNSVQTELNGAIGLGAVWNVRHGALRKVNASVNYTGYYQESGNLWPKDRGYGLYANLSADLSNFRFRAAYWQAHDFFPILGSPLYGVSTYKSPDLLMDNPKTLIFGIEYARSLGKGCSFGADVEFLNHFSGDLYTTDGQPSGDSPEGSFSFGAYLRFNPSVLLKKF